MLIENIQSCVRDRPSNRNARQVCLGFALVSTTPYCCLRGTVFVVQGRVGQPAVMLLHQIDTARFSSDDRNFQRSPAFDGIALQERFVQRRYAQQVGDLVFLDQRAERAEFPSTLIGRKNKSATHTQTPENSCQGAVERKR